MGQHRVLVLRAWTPREVKDAVVALYPPRSEDRGAPVVIKPNLNNDLHALTGNSTDLRVLCALIEVLRDDGFVDITVADGPNVGVERRGIDVFARLRVANLRARYGVRIADLNRDEGVSVELPAGRARIARTWWDAGLRVSVPTLKTHVEQGLSCAIKNHVGTVVAQDKREVHRDLSANVAVLWTLAPPAWVLVDALVGMEGNGPGDGAPVRLGALIAGAHPPAVDRVAAALVGYDVGRVPVLAGAGERVPDPQPAVEALATYAAPPPRSALAVLSERRELGWLKRAVRPVIDRPRVARAVYRLGITQDVYDRDDGGVRGVVRISDACVPAHGEGGACRACADVCPTGLSVAEIGRTSDPSACLSCLACWWACPSGAVALDGGPLGFLERHQVKYKAAVERACGSSEGS